jgi:hypothetical protein
MTRQTYTWAGLGLSAHTLDVLTTHLGLRQGATEQNPVMAHIFASQGEMVGYALKLTLVLAAILFLAATRRRYPIAWRVYQGLALVAWAVVANNLAVLGLF